MNLVEFQQLSKRTMPFNGEPANQVEFENMLGNYAMGLVGESVELLEAYDLQPNNFLNELGDVSHYAIGIATITNLDLNFNYEYQEGTDEELIKTLLYNAKNISEAAKKYIYHRHEEANISNELITIFDCLYTLSLRWHQPDYWEVLQMNIDKLKTRYPEKFSTADSIARKDVQG